MRRKINGVVPCLEWSMKFKTINKDPDHYHHQIQSVTYGNGLYVAVGYTNELANNSGYDYPSSYISYNGNDWTLHLIAPIDLQIHSVTYGNGLFVAVGNNFGHHGWNEGSKIFISTNGITWTNKYVSSEGSEIQLTSVAYGNGLFVAVGHQYIGSNQRRGYSLCSSDCNTWQEKVIDIGVPTTTQAFIKSITYGNGLFVAVGQNIEIAYSRDGINWHNVNAGINNSINDITYGNGLFIVVGGGGYITTSTNGYTWTKSIKNYSYSFSNIGYGNGLFILAGYDKDWIRYLFTSLDGINWSISLNENNIYNIAYNDGLFISAGTSNMSEGIISTAPYFY